MTRPDTERALLSLKDFQRDTVEYVFSRMYAPTAPAMRFLVADEVGLGKTKVAQGVIAKVVDRLWDTVDRIDVVYICSNAAIARQNINRLNVAGLPSHPLPDRITLLPREVKNLSSNRVNFISFTPGTSFNLRSSQGTVQERALLYWLLPDAWKANHVGSVSVLTGNATRSRFLDQVHEFPRYYSIDDTLRAEFQQRLDSVISDEDRGPLRDRFVALANALGRRERLSEEEWHERASIVAELRSRLAASCIHALEPDLIILDEFQRFRDLLHGEDGASDLARQLFTFPEARVLMLSATPYKMFTMADESGGEEHYADFVQTVRFLQHDEKATASFHDALTSYRKELFCVGLNGTEGLMTARASVEQHLRNVMVRTERLAVTADRSGMLTEVPATGVTLDALDVDSFVGLQKVARALSQPDAVEYWKSAPYLLSFMDAYKLKEQFVAHAAKGEAASLASAIARHSGLALSIDDIEAYRRIDPANARLRALTADTLDRGMWRLLWLAPSLPYYELSGEYAGPAAGTTKRLIFSAWHVVPKVVAALLSYEAERRMLQVGADGQPGLNTPDARKRRRGPLRFSIADGRPTGMPALALLYPSLTLALDFDPLTSAGGPARTLTDVHADIAATIAARLDEIGARSVPGDVDPDQRWYWAAPLLLDRANHPDATDAWFEQADLAGAWRGEHTEADHEDQEPDAAGGAAWASHVELARQTVIGGHPLGNAPADLADVLGWMALGAPGVVSLRALGRVCGHPHRISDSRMRNQAGRVASGLLTLFNQLDVVPLVRGTDEGAVYWRRVLEYGARGCVQAVMDEYAHALVEWTGAAGKRWTDVAQEVASAMTAALSLRSANVAADRIGASGATNTVTVGEKFRLRTHFAVRFGAGGEDKAESVDRNADVGKAFNSPFWPFVMCSTSVGQEGLDFHLYCHAVVHWNLPSNPVDLEQREGRVHRFKGHAVRRNVATRFGSVAFDVKAPATDPWAAMFEAARLARAPHESDLVPFWVYPIDGGARIERHIPALPLSKDTERAAALRRSLAVYRMAFGQSRQDDLVQFLLTHFPAEQIERLSSELRINLAPGPALVRAPSPGPILPMDDEPGAVAPARRTASLRALRDLLDRFAEVRPRSAKAGVQQLSSLLDAFRATRQTTVGDAARE